jgi:hypothetical protein
MGKSDFWDRSADAVLVIAYGAAFLFGASLVGWQCFQWLRTSEWPPVPFRLALEFFNADLTSIYFPNSWLGLAKAAQWVLSLPLSLAGPACIVLVAHGWKAFVSTGVAPVEGSAR